MAPARAAARRASRAATRVRLRPATQRLVCKRARARQLSKVQLAPRQGARRAQRCRCALLRPLSAASAAKTARAGGHGATGARAARLGACARSAAAPRGSFGACTAATLQGGRELSDVVRRAARRRATASRAVPPASVHCPGRSGGAGSRSHGVAVQRLSRGGPRQGGGRGCARGAFPGSQRARRRVQRTMLRTGSRAAHAPRAPEAPSRLIVERPGCACFRRRRPSRAAQLAADAALLRGAALGHVDTVLAAVQAGANFGTCDKARCAT